MFIVGGHVGIQATEKQFRRPLSLGKTFPDFVCERPVLRHSEGRFPPDRNGIQAPSSEATFEAVPIAWLRTSAAARL
jgi:hypothetical protein